MYFLRSSLYQAKENKPPVYAILEGPGEEENSAETPIAKPRGRLQLRPTVRGRLQSHVSIPVFFSHGNTSCKDLNFSWRSSAWKPECTNHTKGTFLKQSRLRKTHCAFENDNHHRWKSVNDAKCWRKASSASIAIKCIGLDQCLTPDVIVCHGIYLIAKLSIGLSLL